jgi:23S rRNA (cytidine2498-2'-O)-methyltransferase
MARPGQGARHAPSQETLHAFITASEHEEALAAELRLPPRATPRWPALLTRAGSAAAIDPVFARQQLPGAALVKGESVRELAEGAFALLADLEDLERGPFSVQAYVPDPGPYRTVAARAQLVGDGLRALLGQRRRRAYRHHVPEASAAWPDLLLVQAALVGRTSLLVSAARPRPLPRGGHDLAPWPAGIAPVAPDRRAPSRAYGKLEEAFAWMAAAPAPGERCVDLGGAPGGWAWTALKRGARVLAVDRAPLLPPAAGHPALEAIAGNAFTYEPPAPVDWLLCDVICEPARTIDLVDRWMARALCTKIVATVKFKGRAGYRVLDEAAGRLAAHGWRHLRFKHLVRHQNEAAIMAMR